MKRAPVSGARFFTPGRHAPGSGTGLIKEADSEKESFPVYKLFFGVKGDLEGGCLWNVYEKYIVFNV